jgi:hypothetical protein
MDWRLGAPWTFLVLFQALSRVDFAKNGNSRLNRFWAFLRAGGYKSSDKIS